MTGPGWLLYPFASLQSLIEKGIGLAEGEKREAMDMFYLRLGDDCHKPRNVFCSACLADERCAMFRREFKLLLLRCSNKVYGGITEW